MRKIVVFLLLNVLVMTAFGKGSQGAYYISGIAYGKEKAVLRNTELKVTIGKETQMVQTDQDGKFEITVLWRTPCPSGLTEQQQQKETKALNPDFIFVRMDGNEIKISNEWKRYAKSLSRVKEENTKRMDLRF